MAQDCPIREELKQYHLGSLSDIQADKLAEHVDACSRCAETLASFADEGDTLLEALKRTPDSDAVLAEPELKSMLRNISTIGSDTDRSRAREALRSTDSPNNHLGDQETSAVQEREETVVFKDAPAELPTIPGYEVIQLIASGGMGSVFKARDEKLDRLVAIKLPRPELTADEEGRERFLREARSAAKLRHAHLCPIYEIGDVEGRPYIAMGFINGSTLRDKAIQKLFSVPDAVDIIAKLARALSFAHDRGVIHRDLKPANVLLDEETGEPILTDFGLAKLSSDQGVQMTHTGQVMGTPAYMAPEQAEDSRAASASADIYSLGCTLYHLLIGAPPYHEPTIVKTMLAHREAEIPSLAALRDDVPDELDAVFAKMVAKSPIDRFQSMEEIAKRLDRLCESGALDASSDTTSDSLAAPRRASHREPTYHIKSVIRFAAGLASVAALIVAALYASGILFKFQTSDGTILVRIDGKGDPVEVAINKEEVVTIKDPNDGQPIQVTIDREKGRLQLDKQGFKLATKSFSLETPEGRTVKVTFEPNLQTAPPLAIGPFDADQARQHQQAWADYLGVLVEKVFDLDGGQTLTMVLIPPGEFLMGSPQQERDQVAAKAEAADDAAWATSVLPIEGPQHRVRITEPFYLSKYELTQAQWQSVESSNPSTLQAPELPVTGVSWNDLTPFLKRLNQRHHSGLQFVLPSEAQWEYACRAGTTSAFSFGNDESSLAEFVWFEGNSSDLVNPVGQLKPNAWGLHDMHGNVWEWCADLFESDYYQKSPLEDPQGGVIGDRRMLRGGAASSAHRCRSASRHPFHPGNSTPSHGVRLACRLP